MNLKGRKSGNFVFPGDYLGVIEEFLPREGTYVEDGEIYSSTTGHLLLDLNDRRISVYQKTRTPLIPREGNLVLGKVTNTRDKNLAMRIFQIEDKTLHNFFDGIMHISDVSKGYIKRMTDAYKIADIVRAKVISTKNREFHLTTQGDELGVIQAKCSFCGYNLILDKNRFKCLQCKKIRKRKIADII